jgi:predicted Fe-Mo cluster-binding NifX family protein
LLHLVNGQWTVTVCGGDGLRQAQTLKLAGMQAKSADQLSKKVMDAEAKLTKAQLKQLSLFGEVVKVEATGHHDAGGHKKHH